MWSNDHDALDALDFPSNELAPVNHGRTRASVRGLRSSLNSLNIMSDYLFRSHRTDNPHLAFSSIPAQLRNIDSDRFGLTRVFSGYESETTSLDDDQEEQNEQGDQDYQEQDYQDDQEDQEDHDDQNDQANSATFHSPPESAPDEVVRDEYIAPPRSLFGSPFAMIDYIQSSQNERQNSERLSTQNQTSSRNSSQDQSSSLNSSQNHTTSPHDLFGRLLPELLLSARSSGVSRSSGVALSRLNAIRYRGSARSKSRPGKRAVLAELRKIKQSRAQALSATFARVGEEIRALHASLCSLRTSQCFSPLFHVEDLRGDVAQMVVAKRDRFRTCDWLSPDYKSAMDNFLRRRARGEISFDEPKHPSRKRSMYQRRASKRFRVNNKCIERSEDFHNHDPNDSTDLDDPNDPIDFDSREFSDFDAKSADSVLSSPPCLLLTAGSGFQLSCLAESMKFEADMAFTHVDHNAKAVEVRFRTRHTPGTDACARWEDYMFFASFFAFGALGLPPNSRLSKRVQLMSVLREEFAECLRGHDGEQLDAQFEFVAAGDIIDFKKHDLRFLADNELSWDPLSVRFPKYKASLVRSQLLSWLCINPFVQLKEDYVFLYMEELAKVFNEKRKEGNGRNENEYERNERNDQNGYENGNEGNEKSNTSHVRAKKRATAAGSELRAFYDRLMDGLPCFRANDNARVAEVTRQFATALDPTQTRYIEDWDRRLAGAMCNKLVEECPRTLANIQLNYVLFTVRIDAVAMLDQFLSFALGLVQKIGMTDSYGRGHEYYATLFDVIREQDATAPRSEREDSTYTLVCSLNRKTGQVEIQHSAAHLRHFGSFFGKFDHVHYGVPAVPSEYADFFRDWLERMNAPTGADSLGLHPSWHPPFVSQLLGRANGGGRQTYEFV